METDNDVLILWSYGVAALLYTVFAATLVLQGYLRPPRDRLRPLLLLTLAISAGWAWLMVAATWTSHRDLLRLGHLVDALRYGGWFWFLLALLRQRGDQHNDGIQAFLRWASLLVLSVAVLLQLMSASGGGAVELLRKLRLFSALSLPLMAMVLLEQFFRNASEDSRWNIKPLSLGLAGAFLFDLYLYSEAVLFNRLDTDGYAIRGAVHALVVPFLVLSTSRRGDWLAKIQISRKAAFHSATLVMAGMYLLFISGVGYYVRFFGGEWGRALQLGLVFLGLVGMVVLALSGSVRARVRVFLGKHFFRYRYDYREEWLRFTQTLSAKNSPQEMGEQVIRGLADMLDSPGGALWMKNRGDAGYLQTARWNMVQSSQVEEVDSSLSSFLKSSGWVVNLEEYRSFPRRYGPLALPGWLQETPHAWLIVPLTVADDMIGFVVLAQARAILESAHAEDPNWPLAGRNPRR